MKFKQCYILVRGKYCEVPFSELYINGERNPEYRDRKFLPFEGGYLMEVPKEDYIAEYKRQRREKYLKEESERCREISYHALDADEISGEELLYDRGADVEGDAIRSIELKQLHKIIENLPDDDRWLVDKLYFENISQSDLAKETGISQQTLSYRNKRLLSKIKKIIKT